MTELLPSRSLRVKLSHMRSNISLCQGPRIKYNLMQEGLFIAVFLESLLLSPLYIFSRVEEQR